MPPTNQQDSTPDGFTRNPDLDSFEAVMQAMDAELHAKRGGKTKAAPAPVPRSTPPSSKAKGKGKATFVPATPIIPEQDDGDEANDANVEEAMDAEIRAALVAESDSEDDDQPEPSMDYNLIKNFLESFKSQGGLSGPVSNLVGRLEGGSGLPRDES